VGLIVEIILLISYLIIIPSKAYNIKETMIHTTAQGHWLYVGGEKPGNYTMIQDAINNASNGDTIFVYCNRYQESICVAKQICLIGEDRNTTIIDGGITGTVVQISMSSVTISGFTITNGCKNMTTHGITVDGQPNIPISNVYIRQCIIKNNFGGIRFNYVTNSSIDDCVIHNNSLCSITIYLSSDNINVNNCLIKDNGDKKKHPGGICIDGIFYQCSHIRITNCTIENNSFEGISISRSYHIEIYNNKIIENSERGIFINGIAGPISNILVHNNTITKNGEGNTCFSAGILISSCLNCAAIRNNNILSNKRDGLLLLRTSGNVITKNNIMENARFNAFVNYTCFSHADPISVFNFWNENFWGRSQALPKPIFGLLWIKLMKSFLLPIPFTNVDWHPAKELYRISEMS
jgi:parallel beta-helix repeat protein